MGRQDFMRGKLFLNYSYFDHSVLYIFIEGILGESCVIAAADSCSDPNAQCVNGICECNEGYYDNDGISDNNAGTCTLSKWLCSYLKDSVRQACANGLLTLIRSITCHLI